MESEHRPRRNSPPSSTFLTRIQVGEVQSLGPWLGSLLSQCCLGDQTRAPTTLEAGKSRVVAKAPGPSHTPVAGSRPAVPPCGFCLSNVSPCWCKPVVMGTDISSARQSGSTTLQHPKGDPEAQRQSARMFQNSLFPLLPGGSVGCPLAVLVWGETQAPVVRSLAAWWKGWRRSVTPHSPQLVTYNHSVDLSSCGSLALAAGVKDADGCAVCGGPPPHVLSL